MARVSTAERVLPLLALVAPISYGLKFLWAIEAPFVEPFFVLVLVAGAWRWLGAGELAAPALVLLSISMLSTALAAFRPEVTLSRLLDSWAHDARLAAYLATIGLFTTLRAPQLARYCRFAVASSAASLVLSLLVLAIASSALPNFIGVDLGHTDFEGRFSTSVLGVQVPRLFGLFFEPAFFGAFGLSNLILLYAAGTALSPAWRLWGAMVSVSIVVLSFSDQALLGLAVFCVPYLIGKAATHDLVIRALMTAVVAAALSYVLISSTDKLYIFAEVEEVDALWGSSGGERIANTLLAVELWREDVWSVVLGRGPSLFGVYVEALFPALGDRHQVQFLPADLLVSIGVAGTLAFACMFLRWWWMCSSLSRFWLLGLMLACTFIADFKSPAYAAAVGACIAFGRGAVLARGTRPRQSASQHELA
jgi:hypothetical protein